MLIWAISARAATSRDLVVKCVGCYHGHVDGMLVEAGSGGTGARSTDVAQSRDIGGTGGTGRTVFSEPNPLERWRAVNPTVGDMIVTLMVKHESGHLGQLSAWRRAMGLASVPM